MASPAADGVNAAALLNGVAHGAAQAPNNQGEFAFGLGPYVPGADVAGNFAYYTLPVPPPVVEPPGVTPTDAAGVLPFLPFFGLPGFGIEAATPGDASFRGGELIALLPDIFGVGYGLGRFAGEPSPDGGVGGLEPAAGEDTGGVGGLEPAAGGDDACVETFFADYWTVAAACEIVGGDQTAALP